MNESNLSQVPSGFQRKQSMIYPLGLVNTKQREFFFVSSFVLLLAYASTMFLWFDCIPLYAFCLSLSYAYAASVNQSAPYSGVYIVPYSFGTVFKCFHANIVDASPIRYSFIPVFISYRYRVNGVST